MDSTSLNVFQSLKFTDGVRISLTPEGLFSSETLPDRAEVCIDDRVALSDGKIYEAGPLLSAAEATLLYICDDKDDGRGRPKGTPSDRSVAENAMRREYRRLLFVKTTRHDAFPWLRSIARSGKPNWIIDRACGFSIASFAWGDR